MVLFRPKRKSMGFNPKIKLNRKQLYGIRIDSNLNWKAHITIIILL